LPAAIDAQVELGSPQCSKPKQRQPGGLRYPRRIDRNPQIELQTERILVEEPIAFSPLVRADPDISSQQRQTIAVDLGFSARLEVTGVQASPRDQLVFSDRKIVCMPCVQYGWEEGASTVKLPTLTLGDANPENDLIGLDRNGPTVDKHHGLGIEEREIAQNDGHGGILPIGFQISPNSSQS
jgi:hypothetical protein